MRKRLKKKILKRNLDRYYSEISKYQEGLIKVINKEIKDKGQLIFIDKGIPGGDKTGIIKCRLNGKDFNTIIIDECYTIENEHF